MTVKLGELVNIQGGGTPDRKAPAFWNGNIPWATVKDIKGRALVSTQETITKRGLDSSAANLVSKGAIIVPTRMAVGAAVVAEIDVAINQDLKALTIRDERRVNRDYLFQFLLSRAAYLKSRAKGATVTGITLDVLKELPIELPPIEQQKRIAAILDKADAIRRKRQQAGGVLDELLTSAFLSVFEDELLSSSIVNAVPIADVLAKTRNAAAIGPFGSNLKVSDYRNAGHPVTFVRDIRRNRFEWVSDVFVDDMKFEELQSHRVSPGDIVVTKMGDPAGIAAIYPDYMPEGVITADVIKLSVDGNVCDPLFLSHFLNCPTGRASITRISEGITRKKMRLSDFKEVSVPVPSREKQLRWKEIIATSDNVRRKMNVAEGCSDSLFRSVTAHYFPANIRP